MYFSNVFVCCPANTTTGGPELLHQLVSKLQEKGVDAFILYYPFGVPAYIPEQYRHYNVKVGDLKCVKNDSLVVLPETATKLAPNFSNDQLAIWWLSVDNYFECPPKTYGKAKIKHYAMLLYKKRLSIQNMKKFIHLHQSEYARSLLAKNNIESMRLSDYIAITHTESKQKADLSKKKKMIIFNPKKGFEITRRLIKNFQNFEFVPLQNMTPTQVSELLSQAMIYIDFGNHPGKDRLPREAALANCCVITGVRGSAKNKLDVMIPDKFKIDETEHDFLKQFQTLCVNIFEDFENELDQFETYRNSIRKEVECFEQDIEKLIAKHIFAK